MTMLTQAELDGFGETADASMMDTCVVQTVAGTADAVGGMAQTWTDGDAINCGLRFTSERRQETIEVAGVRYDVDATIRVSLDAVVEPADRIKVTHRYGTTLETPLLFEVLGTVRRGPSANVVKVRQIT